MKMRAIPVLSRRGLHRMRAAQVGLIVGFWLAGEALVRLAHLPLPGGIVGLAGRVGRRRTTTGDARDRLEETL